MLSGQEVLQSEIARVFALLARPRPLVVAAHPDDEILGIGGQLHRLADCQVVHVTDGAPRDPSLWSPDVSGSREDYARLRAREARRALALAGLPAPRIHCLGVPDQDAAFLLVSLSRRLAELIEGLRPGAVFVQPYEGGHPDHDATAFAVHAAVALLRRDWVDPPPLVEMGSYHGPGGRLVPGEFLPSERAVLALGLSGEDRERKQEMLARHASQWRVLEPFPVGVERFRLPPRYDFTRPPHEGTLYYEALGWRLTGERFRQLALRALEELGLPPEAPWH